jgi:hypothetical protein
MYEWRIETALGAVFFEYGDTEQQARNAAAESLTDGEYIIAIERR